MRLKKVSIIILLLVALAVPLTYAKPKTADFTWYQSYSGGGPGEYYGETVIVEYTAVNKWRLTIDENMYVNQTLTQKGTAKIYEWSGGGVWQSTKPGDWDTYVGELLGNEKFHVTEVTNGYVSTYQDWYHVNDFTGLEEWNYHWVINGVYHYVGQYSEGAWYFDILYP
jgi:hypothetical protein